MRRTFTRKVLVLTLFFSLPLAAGAGAQTPAEALDALKQLQQRCESGISCREYGPALEQIQPPVHRFLAGPWAKNTPGFSVHLEKALMHYENAGKVMAFRTGNSNYFLSSQNPELFDLLRKAYPDLKVTEQKGIAALSFEEAVQLMWTMSASEIELASDNMPSGQEEKLAGASRTGDTQGSDAAKLQQQISDLKAENLHLRKENKELRKEIDRRKKKASRI